MGRREMKRQEQTVLKGFGDLASLNIQTKSSVVVPTVTKRCSKRSESDDIITELWNIMDDNKGRTVADICLILKDSDLFDKTDIEQGLAYLHLNGCMIKSNQPNPIYTLKGNTMPPKQSKIKVKEVEKKDAITLGLTDQPTLIERIDIAIWTLMKDRRYRTVADICKEITSGDINHTNSRARMETHYRGSWFERRGSGNSTEYRLNKHVGYPTPKSLGSAQKEEEQMATFKPEEVITPPPVIDNTPPAAPKATVTASAGIRVPDVVIPVKKPAIEDPTLEDGLSTAIWKVMADGKNYNVHDVAALLEHVGIQYTAIANRMSALHLHSGWFYREHLTDNGKRYYSYRLKPEIQMPVGEKTFMSDARKEIIRVANLQKKAEARIGIREHMKPVDNTPPAMEVALVQAGVTPVIEASAAVAKLGSAVGNIVTSHPVEEKVAETPPRPVQSLHALSSALNEFAAASRSVAVAAPPSLPSAADVVAWRFKQQSTGDINHLAHGNKQEIKPEVKPKEEKQMSTQTSFTPLVVVKVEIKGVSFTIQEAEQLMPEIVRLGYSSPVGIKDTGSSLIQTSTTIKGQSFTPQELCDVYRGLSAAGVGKK